MSRARPRPVSRRALLARAAAIETYAAEHRLTPRQYAMLLDKAKLLRQAIGVAYIKARREFVDLGLIRVSGQHRVRYTTLEL